MNRVIKEYRMGNRQLLELVQGDLTLETVDAIVNAANSYLQHGGGVAGAVVLSGGPEIQAQSDAWVSEHGPVSHSTPAFTGAGRLPSRYVIHAVGPVWGEGDEDAKLSTAITASLMLADKLEITSIAFPAISTGIFGFPKDRAARVILDAIVDYFSQEPSSRLDVVRLTLYDQPTLNVFLKVWKEKFHGNSR